MSEGVNSSWKYIQVGYEICVIVLGALTTVTYWSNLSLLLQTLHDQYFQFEEVEITIVVDSKFAILWSLGLKMTPGQYKSFEELQWL